MQQYVFHSNTLLGKFRYFPLLGGRGRILLSRPGRAPATTPGLVLVFCAPLSRSHLWFLVLDPRALYLLSKCCTTEVYPDITVICLLFSFAFGFWDYIAQAGLKLIVPLPLLPQGWVTVCVTTLGLQRAIWISTLMVSITFMSFIFLFPHSLHKNNTF